MGLFNAAGKMAMSKEIEIDTNATTDSLVLAIRSAKLKVKVKGDTMKIKSGIFSFTSKVNVQGTLICADGNWTGSIMLLGQSGPLMAKYATLSAAFKKFTKEK